MSESIKFQVVIDIFFEGDIKNEDSYKKAFNYMQILFYFIRSDVFNESKKSSQFGLGDVKVIDVGNNRYIDYDNFRVSAIDEGKK